MPHRELTPADIMDLRCSLSHHAPTDATMAHAMPLIIYVPSNDAFLLHAYGRAQAMHADPTVLAQCLRCERAEPGFIRRILSPSEPCDVASLSPDLRAGELRRRAAEHARAAAHAAERDAATARRASAIDVSKISLDDL